MLERFIPSALLSFAVGVVCSFSLPRTIIFLIVALALLAFFLGEFSASRRMGKRQEQLLVDLKKFVEEGTHLPSCPDEVLDGIRGLFSALEKQLQEKTQKLSAAEQELELILSAIEDCVLLIDSEQNILLASDASGELLGWEREQLLGQHLYRVIRAAEVRKKMALAQEEGTRQQLEFQALDRCLKGQIMPITGNQYLIILADCTDQERLQQVRRDFASNVSHELRTPLTSIQGFVETLLDGAWQDPEACPHFLKVIKRETERMVRLVADLLDLSRLETRQLDRPIVPVYLVKVASRVVELVEKKAKDKNLDLRFNIADDFPLVMGDKDLLHQVLLNLLDNAIAYTETGFVELRARVEQQKARIEVRDSGPGIAPEDQERIFERFYRVDKARSRHAGGTGLGLAIARFSVERMGGTLSLDSKVGEGSTFWLELPVTSS